MSCPAGEFIGAKSLDGGAHVAVVSSAHAVAPQAVPDLLSVYSGQSSAPDKTLDYRPGTTPLGGVDAMAGWFAINTADGVRIGALGAASGKADGREQMLTPEQLGLGSPPTLRALPNGNWLAYSPSNELSLFDRSGRRLIEYRLGGPLRLWAVSRDGERLAVRVFDVKQRAVSIAIHDGGTGRILATRPASTDEANAGSIAISPDHKTILVSDGCRFFASDATTAAPLYTFGARPSTYLCFGSSNQFGFVDPLTIAVHRGEWIEVWSLARKRVVDAAAVPSVEERRTPELNKTCFFNDEEFQCPTLRAGVYGYAEFGESVKTAFVPLARMGLQKAFAFAFAANGARLFVASEDDNATTVRMWDIATQTWIDSDRLPRARSLTFTPSADGSRVFLRAWLREPGLKRTETTLGLVFDAVSGRRTIEIKNGDAFVGFDRRNDALVLDCHSR